MDYDKIELEVEDLVLDLNNPRTGEVLTQSDALEAVVNLSTKNFRNMMRSIKDHGLDPGDSFYIIQEEDDGDYIVVDGNRRLSALKVLANPLLLKGTHLSESVKRPLEKEAAGHSAPKDLAVSCVLFKNREDANEWIERRHGRGLEGEGRIAWGPLEIQRFQKDRTITDVISFVERNSTFSDAEWSRIKSAVENNTSSLKRFLDSKSGRQHLGFSAGDADGPTFTKDKRWVSEALSQVFSDIASGSINTRTYNKASDIEEYFQDLPENIKKGLAKGGTAEKFATANVSDGKQRPRQAAKANSKQPTKTKNITPVRKTLSPTRLTFSEPTSEKGKQLFREATKLRLKETPLSCAFCFRAIIEHSVDTYMRENSIPAYEKGEELQLAARLERVIDHIYKAGTAHKGDLTPIKTTLTAKSGPVSIGALNGYIHNKIQLATGDDLRNAWDHAVPLFIAVFGAVK